MRDKIVFATDRSELFDFLSKSKDKSAATDFIGRHLVAVILGNEADFRMRMVLEMAGIEVELLPQDPPSSE